MVGSTGAVADAASVSALTVPGSVVSITDGVGVALGLAVADEREAIGVAVAPSVVTAVAGPTAGASAAGSTTARTGSFDGTY